MQIVVCDVDDIECNCGCLFKASSISCLKKEVWVLKRSVCGGFQTSKDSYDIKKFLEGFKCTKTLYFIMVGCRLQGRITYFEAIAPLLSLFNKSLPLNVENFR